MDPKLEKFLNRDGLSEDTVLYRYTLTEYLEHIEGKLYKLSANESATEMVEDLYGAGHLKMAKYVGKGLAFTLQQEKEFEAPEKKCVKLRLKDVLAQGGLVYPDVSSFVPGAYFLTMPEGAVTVELIEH